MVVPWCSVNRVFDVLCCCALFFERQSVGRAAGYLGVTVLTVFPQLAERMAQVLCDMMAPLFAGWRLILPSGVVASVLPGCVFSPFGPAVLSLSLGR